MAKATVKITHTRTRTKATAPKPTKTAKSTPSKGTGHKRCATCGRYM